MAEKTKKKKTTLQKYKTWKWVHRGLYFSKFGAPAIPFGIVLGLNWNDWVGNQPAEGWSIGLGFGMLIVATISAVLAIVFKDEIVKSKVSGLLCAFLVFLVAGFSFKLLATIMNEFGNMFIYVSYGIAGSFALDQTDKTAIKPKVDFYKKLVEENGLDRKSAKRIDDTEQAAREGEEARKERIDLL